MSKSLDTLKAIRKLLASSPEGKLPSKRALARSFKVSPATISNAVRLLKGEGRLRCIPGKGVFLAGELSPAAFGRNHVFGLAGCYMPDAGTFSSEGIDAISGNLLLRGICEAAQEASCTIAMLPWGTSGIEQEALRRLKLEGLIVAGGTSQGSLVKILNLGLPAVLANYPACPDSLLPFLDFDNAWALSESVRLLRRRGRRRIAFLTLSTHSVPSYANWIRERFIIALADAGLPFDNTLYSKVSVRSAKRQTGYAEALSMLKSGNPPDAFICWSEDIALGVAAAASSVGLAVPESLSLVVSCASSASKEFSLFLQPARELGQALFAAVRERAGNPSAPVSAFLKPQFIDNRSI